MPKVAYTTSESDQIANVFSPNTCNDGRTDLILGNYSGAPPACRGYVIFVNKNGSPRNPILLLTGRATPLGVT
ncbi:MAG: hypothetical protein ACI85U_001777 [Candidatus Promineifilaceae bacterium]